MKRTPTHTQQRLTLPLDRHICFFFPIVSKIIAKPRDSAPNRPQSEALYAPTFFPGPLCKEPKQLGWGLIHEVPSENAVLVGQWKNPQNLGDGGGEAFPLLIAEVMPFHLSDRFCVVPPPINHRTQGRSHYHSSIPSPCSHLCRFGKNGLGWWLWAFKNGFNRPSEVRQR